MLAEHVSIGFGRGGSPLSMAQNCSGTVDQLALADLISFLKAIPNGRYRGSCPLPAVVPASGAVLGILSGC